MLEPRPQDGASQPRSILPATSLVLSHPQQHLTNWGPRAVRWDNSGTKVTELGGLGIGNDGWANNRALAINDAGTAVGNAQKYVNGTLRGGRPVQWNANETLAIELPTLGTDATGNTSGDARDINEHGDIVGFLDKFSGTSNVGNRAVRWNANGGVQELGTLGTSSNGYTFAIANNINDSGTVIGIAQRDESGSPMGQRAVRWDAGSTIAIELGHVGTDANGEAISSATDLNDAGVIVGLCVSPRAVSCGPH